LLYYYLEANDTELEESRRMKIVYETLIQKYVEFSNNKDKKFESVKTYLQNEYQMIWE